MAAPHVDQILSRLWQPGPGEVPLNVYAIVDAARSESIYPKIMQATAKKACLHRGKKAEELAWVAPYLVQLERDDALTQWLCDSGWGNSQCIFMRSAASLDELKRHFRTYLTVYDEEGKSYFFRFYDPRVMRVYLPTCNDQEIATVFGEVESFMVEEEDPAVMLHFLRAGQALQKKEIPLD